MDDGAGAVGVARERLEKRRQEAYRARAAATVKIQRWYRRHRTSHRGARRVDVQDSASNQLSPEQSRTESTTSASSSSAVSGQESRGKVDQHSHNSCILTSIFRLLSLAYKLSVVPPLHNILLLYLVCRHTGWGE